MSKENKVNQTPHHFDKCDLFNNNNNNTFFKPNTIFFLCLTF